MNVYTVHLKGSPQAVAALETAAFVREGFSWSALLFGPVWLAWNRLWTPLMVCLVAEIAIAALAIWAPGGRSVAPALQALLHFALAFESAPIRRFGLARRGFRIVDVVTGRRVADAETAFFRKAGVTASTPANAVPGVPAAHPRPAMVGLFPSAGA